MNDLPTLDVLVACDDLVLNKYDGKYHLHGLFTNVWAESFPCTQYKIAIYGRLRDVWKDLPIFVSVNRPSQEGEYGSAIVVQQMTIPGDKNRETGNGIKEFGGHLQGLQFPAPGRYMIVVATAEEVIGHTVINVGKVERKFTGG